MKAGDRVKVLRDDVYGNDHYYVGQEGVIVEDDFGEYCPFRVEFSDGGYNCYSAGEIALVETLPRGQHTSGPWEWRLFATAPTDRTEILVYREDAGVFTALYTPALADGGEEDEDNCCWFTVAGEDLTGDLPTHWMPMPHGPDEAMGTA